MKIIATDKDHLKLLIKEEISVNGLECDLNHIDVSQVTDMSMVFHRSCFTGSISNWDTSCVNYMIGMFYKSQFNGDISKWDVSKVENMWGIFKESQFTQDLSIWKPSSLKNTDECFMACPAPIPYWAYYADHSSRRQAIATYVLHKQLDSQLENKNISSLKVKI